MPSSVHRLTFGAVLAAHALLLGAWWAAVRAPETGRPEPVLRLRLLPAEPGRPSRPLPAPTALRPRPAPSPLPVLPVPPAAPAPAATWAVTASPAEPPPVDTPLPPLHLILPPASTASSPALRDQMLRDPRANSRPARGAGDGLQALGNPGPRVAEETMAGAGRRRVRIGRNCFDVRESRMAQLDPHNRGAVPMPSQVESCN